jgi:hypothetical protein
MRMNRMSRPRRFSRIRSVSPKRSQGTPGGEYNFEFQGRAYSLPGRILQDPTSPDGIRWIGTPESNSIIRALTAQLAGKQCELKITPNCWGWTPLGTGHPHHVVTKGMGAAHADDRLFRCGERIRVWICPSCHRKQHGDVEWSQTARIR